MDENNLSDNMAQITEALNRNTEMLNSLLTFNMAMVPKEQLAKMNLENNIKGQAQAFDGLGNATRGYTRVQQDSQEAAKKYNEAMTNFKAGLDHGQAAVESFSKAVLSGERSYSKYESTLTSLANGSTSVLNNFGLLGKGLGILTQGIAKVGSAYLTQADNVLKASDQLSKFGNAGAMTGEELLKLAHQSGVTSKNLDLLVRPLQSMGSGLVSLGNTVGDGTKAFGRLTSITNKQREEYLRLGVSQGELIQNQADYIKLQTISGRNLSARNKDEASLRKASLEYTDNLLTLSALSGKDIETIKKENEAALSREETLIQTNLMEMEINRLRKTGLPLDEERAKKLEAELKARDALLTGINAQVKDPKMVDAMSKFLATGAVTQESAMLARMGVPIEEFARRIKNGEDVTQEFLNSLKKQGDQTLQNVGVSAMHNKEVRESFGYSKEFLQFLGGRREKDEVAAKKEAEAKIKAAKESGKDPMQDTRAKMVTAEIQVATKFDEIVLAGNPLIAGFDRMTLAIGFASAALTGLVTIGLAKFGNSLVASGTNALAQATGMGRLGAAAGALPGAAGALPGAAGAASAAAPAATAATRATSALSSSMSALTKTLGSVGKVLGSTAGTAGVGAVVGAYQAYSGYQDAAKELKEGKITEEEANKKKGGALGEGAGTASGTLIGAAIGTAILPGIGTAIGGALGGWLGGKGGQLIGEKLGEKVSTIDTAKSDLAEKEKEIVDAKAKQDAAIADQKNATTAEEKAAAARGVKYWEEKLKELEVEKAAKEKIKNKEEELQKKEEKNKEAQAKKEEAIQKAKQKIVEAEAKYAKSMETASLTQKMGFGREADQKKATDELAKAKAELGKMSNRPASSFEQKPTENQPDSSAGDPATELKKMLADRAKLLERGPKTNTTKDAISWKETMNSLDKAIDSLEQKTKVNSNFGAAAASPAAAKSFNTTTSTLASTASTTSTVKQNERELQGQEKIEELERQRKKLEEKGPRTNSLQSKQSYEEMLRTLDGAIAQEKKNQEAVKLVPKAAEGGIFSGPKSGYPVELHGNEAVIPLSSKTELPDGLQNNADQNSADSKEEKENTEAFNKNLKDSDAILKKLIGNLNKWNTELDEQLELKEEETEKLEQFVDGTAGITGGVKNAFFDLNNFTKQIKVVTGQLGSGGAGGSGGSTGGASGSTGGASGSTGGGGFFSNMGAKLSSGSQPTATSGEQQTKFLAELKKQGISDTGSVSNLMAQVQAESGFKARSEDVGKYSAQTLLRLYGPSSGNKVRFRSLEEAQSVVDKGPEAVGNVIYGGRMGNAADEGYKYRGRGLIQLTGKSNYEKYGNLIGVDLVKDPDLANDPDIAAKLAAVYFKEKQSRGVDLSNIEQVGKSVGYAGGQSETRKRAQLAQSYSGKLQSGEIPQAELGGIFDGPMTGYPVEHHGREITAPLDANSILEKLATTPASQPIESTTTTATVTETDINDRIIEMLTDKFDVMISRLDDMINELSESNNTQSDLLKYTKV